MGRTGNPFLTPDSERGIEEDGRHERGVSGRRETSRLKRISRKTDEDSLEGITTGGRVIVGEMIGN